MLFQWSFTWGSRVFKRRNGHLRKVSKVFQGCYKDVLRELQEYLKEGCYKAVSKMFKEVSKAFKESTKCVSIKFQKKYQGCFMNVSMKFYFCNFVLAWISSQLPEQKKGLFERVVRKCSEKIVQHR